MKPAPAGPVVLDASTTLAWCFPDETSPYADDVLVALEGRTILVPPIWSLEIAHAILSGERKKRLNAPEIRRFLTLLENLPFVEERQPPLALLSDTLPIARQHNLSAYDAAYLGVAIRHQAPLATLDARLAKAAQLSGVTIFKAKSGS